MKCLYCLLILGCLWVHCYSKFILPTSSILGLTQIILKSGWNMIEDRSEINLPFSFEQKEKNMLQKMEVLHTEIAFISESISHAKLESIYEIVSHLTKTLKVELKFNDLVQYIDDIDSAYGYMKEYSANKDGVDRSTLEDFAQSVISHQANSVRMSIERIHRFIVPKRRFLNHANLLDLLANVEDLDSNSVCVSQQSANHLLYNLYNTISLTEMKGYAMIQFSYMLLEMYGKGTFSAESQMAREKFVNRSLETAQAMGRAMNTASAQFWRCDPTTHRSGETYLEITQLLQGYVQNEVDLNADGTCKENCAYYQYTKSHSCFDNLYCRQQRRCKGRIFNCQYIDSDMWICPANRTSGRRYNYIEYENGRILGHKGSCSTVKVDSWWRWLFWHCSYCMCLCDEEGAYSDRYISLRAAVSDVADNKVVTGLRFVKKNRIIHLQVQQGTFLPHGVINASTIEWVPVDDMQITDKYVSKGQDYFVLNWENRAIDLDDLHGKENTVLTGVKFKTLGSHLNLEIQVTPIDFESGKLISPQHGSEWLDNTNTDYSFNKRTRIILNKVDVPTKSKSPSQITSNHNQYIEFTHTDFDKDAAQTTVPFLDSQSVVPIIPIPISGAGIYYKSTGNYGGFIGLKLISYNFGKHLNLTAGNELPQIYFNKELNFTTDTTYEPIEPQTN